MPLEVAKTMVMTDVLAPQMYIITNEEKIHGAAAILYEKELYKLAESLKTNLYILPSSIHEIIVVSDEIIAVSDSESLAEMVATINIREVALGERLSDQIYYYGKNLRKVSSVNNN